MTAGSWEYYDHEVSVDDYYAGHGEEAGQWVGSGAAMIGLSGTVEDGQLASLFDEGRHPVTGAALGLPYRNGAERRVVTGFSLSFSPPKSVSLLGAFGSESVAAEVDAAHDAAVHAALNFLEEHAAFSRTGRGGFVQVDTEGFVAAAFKHRTSRAGDPQSHTHVLVANKVRCRDGQWRSLDGRELFAFQKASGMLYNATLRVELSARLGVGWHPVDGNGQADIKGVPPALIEIFSKRHHDVERRGAQRIATAEARLGRTLTDGERAEEFQRATHETRQAKTHEDEAPLSGRWRTEADVAGWDPGRWLSATLVREHSASSATIGPADPAVVAEILAEVSEADSTWSRAKVGKAAARRLPAGLGATAEAGRAWIEDTCSAVLDHPEVVTLASPLSADVPAALRRQDGLAGHERHGASRFTTRQTLAREATVLDAVVRGREAGVAAAETAQVRTIAGIHGLTPDQTAALRRVCEAGERIVCIVGPAGAGKTRLVAAASDVWAANGVPVRGLAVSAVAAGVLALEAGIPSDTVAKFLHDRGRGSDTTGGLCPGEVVVLDEAAMVATADLAGLVEAVEANEAKLVLIGDHRQLGAVEAGGLFRLLVADSRAAELHHVHRFAAPWESAASLRLRKGDDSVLGDYSAHGRIHGGPREAMLDDAYSSWWAARAAGESVVVLAPDHATVDALALRARAERVAAGEVEPGGIAVGAQTVGEGDEIVTTRNDRRFVTTDGLWVRNGDRWRVDARREDGALVVSRLDGAGRVVLPPGYAAEHVTLAYAVTVHKAQGITVDRAVLVACSATTAEHLYVGMTRGRLENRVCVITDAATTGHGGHRPLEAAEILAAVMRRSAVEISATEKLRRELADSEDPTVLRRLWEQARTFIDLGAGPNRFPELRRLEKLRDDLPVLEGVVARKKEQVGRTEQAIAATRQDLAAAGARLEDLTRRRFFRRPDLEAVNRLTMEMRTRRDHLVSLQHQRDAISADLERSERRLADAKREVQRLPEVEAAVSRRKQWMSDHTAELDWEADLRSRLGRDVDHDDSAGAAEQIRPNRQRAEFGDLDIDLRTIDLGNRVRGCGLRRRLDDALGPARRREGVDVAPPPLPGHGIDGPDVGP
jgi:conjugative relaxase-like TrwC/TraI family protein